MLFSIFRGVELERPKTAKVKQSADDLYRQKLELQNEQEDNLEKFQEQMKKEEENEKKKMQTKHELAIKSNPFCFLVTNLLRIKFTLINC